MPQVWPHGEYPLILVGRVVLNRNPKNYFAEVEQSAFCPAHMVPGIEPSPDKMLQVTFTLITAVLVIFSWNFCRIKCRSNGSRSIAN